jgi:DNA-binding transcriptional regulator YhcF (GntR family)
VLPFHVDVRPGLPLYEQVILAVKRALISGELKPGEAFPSLRKLAEALRINPNAAAKIVSLFKQEGVLEAIPGVGMIVSETSDLLT